MQAAQASELAVAWKVPVLQGVQELSTKPLHVLASCVPAGQVLRQRVQTRSVELVGAALSKDDVLQVVKGRH